VAAAAAQAQLLILAVRVVLGQVPDIVVVAAAGLRVMLAMVAQGAQVTLVRAERVVLELVAAGAAVAVALVRLMQ
jgi:hypothetical protein